MFNIVVKYHQYHKIQEIVLLLVMIIYQMMKMLIILENNLNLKLLMYIKVDGFLMLMIKILLTDYLEM
jgi:hypothetical protein